MELLQDEYFRRKTKNPQYSKRAFARDLGISKSSLHEAFAGRKKFSKRSIEKVVNAIGLSEQERSEFIELRSTEQKPLGESEFGQIYHWFYFAILSLAETNDAKADPQWISERLGIKEDLAEQALQRLISMDMVEIDQGELIRKSTPLSADFKVPSRHIKIYHSENLSRAEDSLFNNDMKSREITSITSALSEEQFERVKKEAEKFRQRISKITEKKTDATEVYTMALQIFPQTKGGFRAKN